MSGLATSIITSDATAVAAGAVIGALSRYQLGEAASAYIPKDTMRAGLQGWHTAGINIAGSFVLGGLAGTPTFSRPPATATAAISPSTSISKAPSLQGLSPRAKLMLGVGFCGSFTTFSTFSVDVAKWITEGQIGKAGGYVLANNVGGIMAAAAGMVLMKKVFVAPAQLKKAK